MYTIKPEPKLFEYKNLSFQFNQSHMPPMPHFMIEPRARTSKSLDPGVCQCRSITISLGYFIIKKNNQKGGNNICILVMDVLLMGEQVYQLQVGFGSSWVNAGCNFYNSLSHTEKAKNKYFSCNSLTVCTLSAILISLGNS